MVIGVPLFATILSVVKEFAEWCLKYRGIDKEGRPLNPDGTPQVPETPAEPEPVVQKPMQQHLKQKQNRRASK